MKFSNNKALIVLAALLCAAVSFAEEITFNADSMQGSFANDENRTTLSGNAVIKTESMELSADSVELYGEDFRYISAVGTVKGSLPQSNMTFTCGKMLYDRETKIATLENDVQLIDTENDVNAKAEYIEYNQDLEIAVMQLSVYLTQKDNVCTAAYSVYRKKDQLLDMSGNPKVVQGKDTFRAQEITLNLSTQEITLDGRVSGSITTERKDEEK